MKYMLIAMFAVSFQNSYAQFVQYDSIPAQKTEADKLATKPDSELKKKFLKESKIELGYYAPIKGSSDRCLEGDLTILDFGNSLTLMLGARPLAAGVGRTEPKVEENDFNCHFTYEISSHENKISGTDTQTCGERKIIFHTNVEIEKGQIKYTKDAVENDKVVDKLECTVKKTKN